jgi:hypothetical protein
MVKEFPASEWPQFTLRYQVWPVPPSLTSPWATWNIVEEYRLKNNQKWKTRSFKKMLPGLLHKWTFRASSPAPVVEAYREGKRYPAKYLTGAQVTALLNMLLENTRVSDKAPKSATPAVGGTIGGMSGPVMGGAIFGTSLGNAALKAGEAKKITDLAAIAIAAATTTKQKEDILAATKKALAKIGVSTDTPRLDLLVKQAITPGGLPLTPAIVARSTTPVVATPGRSPFLAPAGMRIAPEMVAAIAPDVAGGDFGQQTATHMAWEQASTEGRGMIPQETIQLDLPDSIKERIREIGKMLSEAKIQRLATSEHKNILGTTMFRNKMRRLLSDLDSRGCSAGAQERVVRVILQRV